MKNFINIGAPNIRYDGVDLSHYFNITDAQIQVFPEITVNATKIPGKPGSRFNSREVGERTLTFTMSLKTWDKNPIHIYQFWREYAPLILKEKPCSMTLDESKEIFCLASSAADIERIGTRGVSEVSFVAPDPFFYGVTHEIELSNQSTSFVVLGGYEVWPTIEITGASEELIIFNEITGDRIRIPSVRSGAKVVVDMENACCTSNGEYMPVDLTITDYFSLPLGEAKIKLSQGSGTLKYRERYL